MTLACSMFEDALRSSIVQEFLKQQRMQGITIDVAPEEEEAQLTIILYRRERSWTAVQAEMARGKGDDAADLR